MSAVTDLDLGTLKQQFKFQSRELAEAKTKNRKLEKALAAKPKEVIAMAEEYQQLYLMRSALERFVAEPSWPIEQKYEAMRSTLAQYRAEQISEGSK